MPVNDLPAAPRGLTNAELDELDALLGALPDMMEPLNVATLDGYLCGVIAQPTLIPPDDWLPVVYDTERHLIAAGAQGVDRIRTLVLRHHAELNRALFEDGWFEPLIVDEDEAAAVEIDADHPLARLSPISRQLLPWVVGFQLACTAFPGLLELEDDAVVAALARLFRHLPAETDDELEMAALLDRESPLATLDAAIDELVATVADLADLTHDERYRVETVRRDAPKVGRNDRCPCGSGKKYKHCHGAR